MPALAFILLLPEPRLCRNAPSDGDGGPNLQAARCRVAATPGHEKISYVTCVTLVLARHAYILRHQDRLTGERPCRGPTAPRIAAPLLSPSRAPSARKAGLSSARSSRSPVWPSPCWWLACWRPRCKRSCSSLVPKR